MRSRREIERIIDNINDSQQILYQIDIFTLFNFLCQNVNALRPDSMDELLEIEETYNWLRSLSDFEIMNLQCSIIFFCCLHKHFQMKKFIQNNKDGYEKIKRCAVVWILLCVTFTIYSFYNEFAIKRNLSFKDNFFPTMKMFVPE